MKRLIFLIPLFCILACNRNTSTELTLISYNVGNFSKYMENSIPDVAGLIASSGASIVALNELDSCNRRHDAFQAKDLAEAIGDWDYHFAAAFPYKGGSYGNAVVTSDKVLRRDIVNLAREDGKEPRVVAVVETDKCVLGSVHIDFRGEIAPSSQVETATEWFKSRYGHYSKPVFLCGDFNHEPGSDILAQVEKDWTLISGEDFTYPTEDPCKCIDFICVLKDAVPVHTVSWEVMTEGTELYSDHFPVKAVVSF